MDLIEITLRLDRRNLGRLLEGVPARALKLSENGDDTYSLVGAVDGAKNPIPNGRRANREDHQAVLAASTVPS